MTLSSIKIEPNFNKHYLLFGHNLTFTKITADTHFPLDPHYRIVTLHAPEETIQNKLIKIVTNQINAKSPFINNLFIIKCPIARGNIKRELENSFIKGYFTDIYLKTPDKLPEALEDILYVDPLTVNIHTLTELNTYLETLNYDKIKRDLNFEIRIYRPGDQCPKLLIDFDITNNQSKLKGNIYDVNTFKNFNLDEYELLQDQKKITNDTTHDLTSCVNFKLNKKYFFDETDVKLHKNSEGFFNTINPIIPTGLIIVLSSGAYYDKTNFISRNSLNERQNAYYKKYAIEYTII